MMSFSFSVTGSRSGSWARSRSGAVRVRGRAGRACKASTRDASFFNGAENYQHAKAQEKRYYTMRWLEIGVIIDRWSLRVLLTAWLTVFVKIATA